MTPIRTPPDVKKALSKFKKASEKARDCFEYYSENIIEGHEPLERVQIGDYINVIMKRNEKDEFRLEYCGQSCYYVYPSISIPHTLHIKVYTRPEGDVDALFVTTFELESIRNRKIHTDYYHIYREHYNPQVILELAHTKLNMFINQIEHLSITDKHQHALKDNPDLFKDVL